MPYQFITDSTDFREMLEELGEYQTQGGMVSLDTETTGLDPLTCQLLLVQLGIPGRSWVVDARRVSLEQIGAYLDGKQWIGQNLLFDLKFLKYHTGAQCKVAGDTLIAEQVLTAGTRVSVSLVSLAKKYLGRDISKEVRGTFIGMKPDHAFTHEQLEYAASDVEMLFPIHEKQLVELKAARLLPTYRLERAVVPVVAAMELEGILVDQIRWRELLARAEPERDRLALEINRFMGGGEQLSLFDDPVPTFNVNSNAKLLHGLRKMGIPVEDTLERSLAQYDSEPVIQAILLYRGKEKLLSSFGESLLSKISPVDNRLHCSFKQLGTDTGRFSSSSPNLQNLPHDESFRSLFIAPPGSVLVSGDMAGQEMRVAAQLSGDEALIKIFQEGRDIHKVTASFMLGVAAEDVTKDQRTLSKVLSFATLYGRGKRAMAEQLKVTPDEAQGLLDQYFRVYPQLGRWVKEQKAQVWDTHESRTLLGRRRILLPPDELDEEYTKKRGHLERCAVNSPVQGSSADQIKLAMIKLYLALPSSCKTLLTIHDELVVEVPEDLGEEMATFIHNTMVEAGKQLLPDVPVESEVKVGKWWIH